MLYEVITAFSEVMAGALQLFNVPPDALPEQPVATGAGKLVRQEVKLVPHT